MNKTLERKLSKLDESLQQLAEKRRHTSDPVVIMDMSESIDKQLDERISLMRAREGGRGDDDVATRS